MRNSLPREHHPFASFHQISGFPSMTTSPSYTVSFVIPATKNRTVAVLGAGVLERRIATCWAAGGYKVNLRDLNEQQLKAAREYIKSESLKYPGKCGAGDLEIQVFQDLKTAVAEAFLVIECAPEILDLKQETFVEPEQLAPPDAILATNSSSYKSREIASRLQLETRKRVLNLHYTMPPTHMVVELMTCGDTQADIFPFLVDLLREFGMKPIITHKESTGFVFNRVWAAVKRECLMILAEGVSTPEELDAVRTDVVANSSSGPFSKMDAVGLDTVALIEKHYIKERGLQNSGVIIFL
jgi:3-hydroxyacyl-CoA dehydrogenase